MLQLPIQQCDGSGIFFFVYTAGGMLGTNVMIDILDDQLNV